MYQSLNPAAYEAGYAFGFTGVSPGKFADGYSGAEIVGPNDPPSSLEIGYSAYCEGYCEGIRIARAGFTGKEGS